MPLLQPTTCVFAHNYASVGKGETAGRAVDQSGIQDRDDAGLIFGAKRISLPHTLIRPNEKLVECEGGQMSFGPIILIFF